MVNFLEQMLGGTPGDPFLGTGLKDAISGGGGGLPNGLKAFFGDTGALSPKLAFGGSALGNNADLRRVLGLPPQSAASAVSPQQAQRLAVAAGVAPGAPAAAPPAAPGTAGFIAQQLPYAQAAVQQAGATLDPAIAVAVAANETGYGTTGGTPWNSLHGIRGVGPAGQTPGGFRAYATPQESYADFVRLVTDPNGRYAPAYQGYQQSRDAARFIQDIAAAGYALAGPEAQAWVPQVQSIYQQVQNNQPWVAPTVAGATGGIRPGVSQNALGLDAATAAAICGPAAAIWFAQNFGRNPSVGEAMELAKQSGWTQQSGMAGPQSQVRLLQGLGVPAQLMAPDPQAVAREIQAGRPVILSSPGATGHYFQVTDYRPATGEFQFGDAVGRGRWSTLDRVGQFGYGQPDTAIVVRQ